ncbi:MAG TPA: RNA polymerase factor sigma-54 [Methylocystis sp.]|nr:RNA polymerase factor sigma-54 [Methylocystis sp.]
MAISQKLMMRQGQSLVMTPQLLQAIKLLQFSSAELTAFLQEEMERNPLLESEGPSEASEPAAAERGSEESFQEGVSERVEGDWAKESLSTDAGEYAANLGADVSNLYDSEDTSRSRAEAAGAEDTMGLSASSWTGALGGGGGFADGETPNLEAYVATSKSLRDTLEEQLSLACEDPRQRLIGSALIDAIDENGYLREMPEAIAERLGASLEETQAVLEIVQRFEPSGVGARDLAECLAIQLRERDRFDPAMQIFVANLALVAKADFAQLSRLCGVDEDDVRDMAAELRGLDPKPGRAIGGGDAPAIVADVIVTAAGDGSWRVELNTEALPRVLINNSYVARVSASAKGDSDKSFVSNCLQNANWLVKSLEQRQRTILKVASEIVRLQDAFFERGVEHLRPLNLRVVADAISMHESTVSRVTSNKYMMTPRGLFELKYFFSASIAAASGAEAHSAEAVRFKIKQMIDKESPNDVLSDDAIVARLKELDIDIARRTVAKYRDSLRIPSSVDRRRQKLAAARQQA